MPKAEQIPPCPARPTVSSPGGHCYEIELITPLFGGGAKTRETDPSFPIRPTSIRGQLQFWWRATVGAQYATPRELRLAQTEVWGNTECASRVQVKVEVVKVSGSIPCARYEQDSGRYRSMPTWNPPFQNTALPYALFPFQGQLGRGRREIEIEPASCITEARFQLILQCDRSIDFTRQVEPALWAWVHFGGLGSRTRRGCGSLRCLKLLAKDRNELLARLRPFVAGAPDRQWPTLAATILVGNQTDSAIKAWADVIALLREFRQGPNLGRNPGQRPQQPGRSRWPEPETIRRITNARSSGHQRMDNIPDDAFPRAEFGLPIVFHFKDEGDPPDTVLYPARGPEGPRERMASPLILKAAALQNNKYVPLIVLLKTPPLQGVDLRRGDQSLPLPQTVVVRDPRLARYPNSPMAGRSASGSAVEAFLTFAKSKNFTEVQR